MKTAVKVPKALLEKFFWHERQQAYSCLIPIISPVVAGYYGTELCPLPRRVPAGRLRRI